MNDRKVHTVETREERCIVVGRIGTGHTAEYLTAIRNRHTGLVSLVPVDKAPFCHDEAQCNTEVTFSHWSASDLAADLNLQFNNISFNVVEVRMDVKTVVSYALEC